MGIVFASRAPAPRSTSPAHRRGHGGLASLLLATPLAMGCAGLGGAAPLSPSPSCRLDTAPVRWALAGAPRQPELDRWCAAVGNPTLRPPTLATAEPPPSSVASDPANPPGDWTRLLVISWNMNGDNGDLRRLLGDAQEGVFGAADRVVVFLQEAPRRDASVPPAPPDGSLLGKRLGSGEAEAGGAADVIARARGAGLGVVYVPSMRNGSEDADRGNAILSDLPLAEPVSVELPLVRDRRVAVSAEIPAPGVRRFRVTALHLDHLAEWSKFGRSFGSARTEQVAALLEALPWHDGGILAGDFNAWHSQEKENGVLLARKVYPSIEVVPHPPTVTALWGLARRRNDFIVARLPEGWRAEYQVWPDRYGSDHHPLVGVVRTR